MNHNERILLRLSNPEILAVGTVVEQVYPAQIREPGHVGREGRMCEMLAVCLTSDAVPWREAQTHLFRSSFGSVCMPPAPSLYMLVPLVVEGAKPSMPLTIRLQPLNMRDPATYRWYQRQGRGAKW